MRERLAQHAFRGEVWDKAVAYCRQAGTKALARSALREVVACCEQALAALTHLPESRATQEQAIDLRFALRDALTHLGENRQVLDYLRPWVDLYKVDLKSFDDRHYRQLGGRLEPILYTIRRLHAMGFWVEIVTLIIPGFNDDVSELRDMARFLASVSRDIPWHVTAFHKDYRMTDPDATAPEKLMRACEIGAEAGLRYIYAGNLPGRVGPWENTRCPGCGEHPPMGRVWVCGRCNQQFDTFETGAVCPRCELRFDKTACFSCGEAFPIELWYIAAPPAGETPVWATLPPAPP